jgi:copper chaperone CopZ
MIEIKVEGMSCLHCSSMVARALKSVPGVLGVDVDLQSGLAKVEEGTVSADELLKAIRESGYWAELAGESNE